MFLAVQDSSIGDLVTHSLSEWVRFWFQRYNDYNDYNDYSVCSDYNNYNGYRDRDLDLDWEWFSELVK